MRGEDTDVLSALSDVSDDESAHIMDPSDPRAHRATSVTEVSTVAPVATTQISHVPIDSESDLSASMLNKKQKSDDDRKRRTRQTFVSSARNEPMTDARQEDDVITIDDDPNSDNYKEKEDESESSFKYENDKKKPKEEEEEEKKKELEHVKQKSVTLSKWAQARFLAPAGARKVAVVQDTCLEPLNDFILSDFGSRFRGNLDIEKVEKALTGAEDGDADEDEVRTGQSSFKHVGAPLYETTTEDRQMESGEKKDRKRGSSNQRVLKNDGEGRKRKESRYFVTDLATKCYHCGEVGHMASVCMNDKLQPPCHYCALRGHQSWACPNLPCAKCLQIGHEEKHCINRALSAKACRICGCAGHVEDDCGIVDNPEQVTCMVCTRVGHLQCVPVPPPADRRVYCPNCAENHKLERCRRSSKSAPVTLTARMPSGRFVQTCFACNKGGHIAAECPTRWNGYSRSRDGCFKCGRSGHFAAECRDSGNYDSNGRRETGRKRYRDVENEYSSHESHRRRRS